METTANAVRKDPSVRSALKEQQLARIAMKKRVAAGEVSTEDYLAAYASQPEQVAKRSQQEARSAARQAARKAANSSSIASAKGAAEAFGGAVTADLTADNSTDEGGEQ